MVLKSWRKFARLFYQVPYLVPDWDSAREKKYLKRFLINPHSGIESDYRQVLIAKIKELYNIKYAFDFNLGRSALEVGLDALHLNPNSEVILSSYSCRGVIEPILVSGLIPVLVDIDSDYNISPESIEKNITPRTKAIIMSHLYGKPAQIDKIIRIAKKHKLYLIDDAAQVVGLEYNGKMVGTFGDFGVLSFGIGKSLSATAGGFLITNSKTIADRVPDFLSLNEEEISIVWRRALRVYLENVHRKWFYPFFVLYRSLKMPNKYYHIRKMSNLDSALVLFQLQRKDEIISQRINNSLQLLHGLKNKFKMQAPSNHIYTKFVIQSKKPIREFTESLRDSGIEVEHNYKPLHLYDEYAGYAGVDLKQCEKIWQNVVTIPNRTFYKV